MNAKRKRRRARTFAQLLADHLEERGRLTSVAAAAGLSKQYVHDLAIGRRSDPRLSTILALAHALECLPGDLMPED